MLTVELLSHAKLWRLHDLPSVDACPRASRSNCMHATWQHNTRSGGPVIYIYICNSPCTSSCENCGVVVWNFCDHSFCHLSLSSGQWRANPECGKTSSIEKYLVACVWHVVTSELGANGLSQGWLREGGKLQKPLSSNNQASQCGDMRSRCISISSKVYWFGQTSPMMCILVQLC